MRYWKYHGLGNDYLVIRPEDLKTPLRPDLELGPDTVARICRRRFGIGSDGILLGPLDTDACDFGIRIFNSDGSTGEKSGNGLRIFARFLFDRGLVGISEPFTVQTDGGVVTCQAHDGGRSITAEMGQVSFDSQKIPVQGPPREVLNENLEIDGETLTFCAATVGNPHCVVLTGVALTGVALTDTPTPEMAKHLGPLIEAHPLFPHRTNVQFMRVIDRAHIQIEIWERGSGYTLASGSSSTASAAVAHKLGLCDRDITVLMPGGRLNLQFDEDLAATLTGPVTYVGEGILSPEILEPDEL